MNTDKHRFILGKKTKEEILKDVETRFIQFVVGLLIIVTVIILMAILSAKNLPDGIFEKIIPIVLITLATLGVILFCLSLRCPFCDKIKWRDYWASKYFTVNKGTYKCFNCNLSDAQIDEITDMLERGVEIDKEAFARFNKRDL